MEQNGNRLARVKRGEVWLTALDDSAGYEISKTRPAIIIQNDVGNEYSPTTIVAPITSRRTDMLYPTDVLLMQNAGLSKTSKALLNQIRTIDKRRLVKRLGKIDGDTSDAIDEAIKISLGLVAIE